MNGFWDVFFYLTTFLMLFGFVGSVVVAIRKRHPRELFAFYAVIGWVSWVVWWVPNEEAGGQDFEGMPPNLSQEAAFLFILFAFALWVGLSAFLLWWARKVHRNWQSEVISEKDFAQRKRQQNTSIFRHAWEQFKVILMLEWSLKLYQAPKRGAVASVLAPIDRRKVPWRINALEILQLLNHQYKVDTVKSWYSDHDCYLCTYGSEDDCTAILCCEEKPDQATILQLLQFVTFRDGNYDQLLILIEQGNVPQHQERMGAAQVVYRYKAEMLDALVDFKLYFKDLKTRFTKEEIYLGSRKTLQDIYTPLSARPIANHTQLIPNVEHCILDWAKSDDSPQHFAIFGEYGQGKSVLSLHLCLALSQQANTRVPILIELRGKSPRTMNPEELLFIWASQYGIPTASLLKLHQEGRLVLIFEGFDEMDLAGDRNTRLDHFRQLWKFAQAPQAKLLFTGRPNFFMDDLEQRQALGILDYPSTSLPYCEAFHLQRFTPEQLLASLRDVEYSVRTSIIALLEKQAANKDSSFYQLIARPSTLSLITIIWKKAYFDRHKDQLNSARVMNKYIQFAYERQEEKQSLMPLTNLERQYFMQGIAVGMMKQEGYSNQISSYQLDYLMEQLLEHIPGALSSTPNRSEVGRSPLKERVMEHGILSAKHKETILTDIRTCGILVKDTTKEDYFKFAHKSFLEYLVSEFFVAHLLARKPFFKQACYGINRAITEASSIRQSPEVINFIGELLANEPLPDSPYSAAQELQRLLKISVPGLYIAFMKKKVYLRPSSFFTGFSGGFFSFFTFYYATYYLIYSFRNPCQFYFDSIPILLLNSFITPQIESLLDTL